MELPVQYAVMSHQVESPLAIIFHQLHAYKIVQMDKPPLIQCLEIHVQQVVV